MRTWLSRFAAAVESRLLAFPSCLWGAFVPAWLGVSLLAVASLAAQDRGAEVLRPAVPVRIDPATQRTDVVVVKFVEGHRVRRGGRGELACATLDLDAVRALVGRRRVSRVFTRPVAELEAEKTALEARVGRKLPDLNNYYHVQTFGRHDAETLLDGLLADPAIETAYPEFGPGGIVATCPDIPPPTPNFESRQGYLGAAPGGLGHLLTRSIDGAQGVETQIVADLSGGWNLGHEDAENLVLANVIGTKDFGVYGELGAEHDTATFGIINATRNAYGMVGFAPLAQGKVSSVNNGESNMISLATAVAKAGDVFTSSLASVVKGRQAPFDWPQATFDAIKIATAKGICYTYAAGNSGADLGNTAIYGNRYTANAPESGGFIIGGTYATSTKRHPLSNHGVKVIANGWMERVATLGFGDLFTVKGTKLQHYTAKFWGTSAATPQVAGVIASLQGAAMRQNGKPLTPAQVRALLKVYGTPVTGNIGLRPDLAKLMKAILADDGLLVTREAAIGAMLDIEVTAAAGRLFMTVGAAARGRILVGLNRPVLVDLGSLFVVAAGQIGAGGKHTLRLPVPNVTALRGKSLFAQTLDAKQDLTGLHLTNSVEAYIR